MNIQSDSCSGKIQCATMFSLSIKCMGIRFNIYRT
jgi:hypothetical protein